MKEEVGGLIMFSVVASSGFYNKQELKPVLLL